MRSSAVAALAALAYLITPITAHSWVEEMDVIDPKSGTFTGTPGYCRNNTKRGDPSFKDPLMVHILPSTGQPSIEERDAIPALDTTGINSNDPMCKRTQQTQYQSDGSPRLQAAPGALVSLRYQENGHVTLPQNQPGKPPNRGLVYVYGTSQPKTPELLLDIFGQWNEDGSGGDKRGKLLATQPFDDGRCYQVNGGNISVARKAQYAHTPDQLMGADLWCQNNIALPTDIETGKPYTIYWVWSWPTLPGVDPNLPNGKAEVYTTCMDVDIAKPASKRRVKARQAPSASENLNSAAIPEYVSSLTASPAPAGASPVVSAQASPASSDPTTPAAQVAGSNSMTNAGVASYIEQAVSAAIASQVPKAPVTVTVDIVQSTVAPMTAGAVAATQPAVAPAASPAAPPAGNPQASNQAASPSAVAPTAPVSTPAQAPAPAPSSMPPKSLDINPPMLSASPSAPQSVSPPGFTGTASPVVASPAVASPAVASPAVASPAGAPGVSQNGTAAAGNGKRQCTAKTCKSKRQSRIFGKKSGGG